MFIFQMGSEGRQFSAKLSDLIFRYCHSNLSYHQQIRVEGLVAVTLDSDVIVLVNIQQEIASSAATHSQKLDPAEEVTNVCKKELREPRLKQKVVRNTYGTSESKQNGLSSTCKTPELKQNSVSFALGISEQKQNGVTVSLGLGTSELKQNSGHSLHKVNDHSELKRLLKQKGIQKTCETKMNHSLRPDSVRNQETSRGQRNGAPKNSRRQKKQNLLKNADDTLCTSLVASQYQTHSTAASENEVLNPSKNYTSGCKDVSNSDCDTKDTKAPGNDIKYSRLLDCNNADDSVTITDTLSESTNGERHGVGESESECKGTDAKCSLARSRRKRKIVSISTKLLLFRT